MDVLCRPCRGAWIDVKAPRGPAGLAVTLRAESLCRAKPVPLITIRRAWSFGQQSKPGKLRPVQFDNGSIEANSPGAIGLALRNS
jgi:hypothetical protein